jgi:acetylornithine deacetylase/succinyl-diaminopimelate desuccinylase-like protein
MRWLMLLGHDKNPVKLPKFGTAAVVKILIPFCFCAGAAFAQPPGAILNEPAVHAAMENIRRIEPWTLERQASLCEIPAPPFGEEARGREVKRLFEELGLRDVRTDSAGNVIGVRPGKSPSPNTVFAAHLDTVFPEGTPVAVKREGALMKAPGISDNARGLAVLLAIIRAFKESGIETAGTLTFVADVGEEGLGDLRGMKTLFNQTLKGRIDRFVSIDGSGLGVTNIGVGSFRYRVVFSGPGGHSYGSFGMANPIHAMGRAIAKIAEFRTPATPRTTFNVSRVGGGASVNSIASEAWMEVDLRSSDETALAALDDLAN